MQHDVEPHNIMQGDSSKRCLKLQFLHNRNKLLVTYNVLSDNPL